MPAVTTKYRLVYFDLDGRAEVARLLFAEAGVPFEDKRIPFEKWAEVKPTTLYGQIPQLEFDGKILAQSFAINRYLGGEFGLYGSNAWEAAKIDELILKMNEELEKIVPLVREPDKKKQAELFPELLMTIFVPLVALLDKKLAESKSGWVIGDKLTAADLSIFHTVVNLPRDPRLPSHDFANLDHFPNLARLVETISKQPKIAAYLAEKKKRQEKSK